MPTLPFLHPGHTPLCDTAAHSNQLQSHLWSSIAGGDIPEHYDPGAIRRWSLQMQGPSALSPPSAPSTASFTAPTNPTARGTQNPRFAYLSPPPSITPNCSGSADAGYPLNSPYQPHPHHPASTTSPTMPPFPHSSIPFDPRYRAYDPPSIQHDIQPPSQVPYPSPELPYHPHHGPPAHPQVLPPSAGLSMHKLCQASPVPAVPHMRTWASFQARPPIIDALHCSSSAPYNETELYRLPSFEPDSIHWNSPPTSSGLPLTPSDNTVAPQLPQLPYFSQLPPSKSPPQQSYVVPVSVLPFSNGPAFPTGKLETLTDTQAASLQHKSSLNQGTKDVFQSLKRKRLPVAASFSRPKPRMLPVKKVLPKIHGCQTCGKMFDRPSTLLVHQASHTKAKDYACNKCRKTFSVNSNMRRHWRNCTETPRDYSVPSSPSVPIKQEVSPSPSDPSDPSETRSMADSPPPAPVPGPPEAPIPTYSSSCRPPAATEMPRQQQQQQQTLTPPPPPPAGVSVSPTPTPTPTLPPNKMAVQPPSIRGRFNVVTEPEIATPVPPVQPRMSKAQEEEMKGWFLEPIWRSIVGRIRSWRPCRLVGGSSSSSIIISSSISSSSSPPTRAPAASSSPPSIDATTTIVDDEDPEDGASAKKRWGEERDSYLNPGYAPYFGAQWNGVLPGPGPEDLPAVPAGIADDEEMASEVPC